MPDSTAGVATRNVSGKRRAGGAEAQQPGIALERLGVASSPALMELLPRLIVTVAAGAEVQRTAKLPHQR